MSSLLPRTMATLAAAMALLVTSDVGAQPLHNHLLDPRFERIAAEPEAILALFEAGPIAGSAWEATGSGIIMWREGNYFGTVVVPDSGDAGRQTVNLIFGGTGGIRQSFATTPGVTYNVSYDIGGFNATTDPGTAQMDVLINGSQAYFYDVEFTGGPNEAPPFQTRTFSFEATSTTTTIDFVALTKPFIDDSGALLDNIRVTTPGVFAPVYVDVNSVTGEVVLRTTTALTDNVIGYELISAATAGSLDATNWTSITDNYDSDSGPTGGVQVDTNDPWTKLPMSSTSIGETELNAPAGNGAQFPNNLAMSLGQIWQPHPFGNDLSFELLLENGTILDVPVVFNGDESANPVLFADYNGNGMIDASDWAVVRDNAGSNLEGLSVVSAYRRGDLNLDGVNDVEDFFLFAAEYDNANGAGAFASLVGGTSVPEPSAVALALCGLVGIAIARRRGGSPRCLLAMVAGLGLLVAAHPASAVTFRFDFDGHPDGGHLTYPGFVGVGIPDSPIDLGGLGTLDISGVDGEFDAHFFIDNATNPNDLNLDFIYENSLGESPIVIGGVQPSDVVSVRVYTSGFRDTNFTYNGTTTLVDRDSAHMLIDRATGQSNYTFIFSAGTTDNEGNISAIEIFFGEPELLTLEIERGTGLASIRNNSEEAIELKFYEIESATGALDPGFTGLSSGGQLPSGNGTGNGWEKHGAANHSGSYVAESYLQNVSLIPGASPSYLLGNLFDGAGMGDEEGISFTYYDAAGIQQLGLVSFIDPDAFAGDFNLDGKVDAADYVLWRNNVGQPESVLNGNGNGSGVVDIEDYELWKLNYGNTATGGLVATANAVPEPSTMLATLMAASGMLYFTRRRVAF